MPTDDNLKVTSGQLARLFLEAVGAIALTLGMFILDDLGEDVQALADNTAAVALDSRENATEIRGISYRLRRIENQLDRAEGERATDRREQ